MVALSRVPAWSLPLFFVVGAVSQYVGAGLGVFLFQTTGSGLHSLAAGMAAAAVLLAAPMLAGQLATDATVFADARTWWLGIGLGMLSTAVPYALNQVVLPRIGRARFGLLLALLPATAVSARREQ